MKAPIQQIFTETLLCASAWLSMTDRIINKTKIQALLELTFSYKMTV